MRQPSLPKRMLRAMDLLKLGRSVLARQGNVVAPCPIEGFVHYFG